MPGQQASAAANFQYPLNALRPLSLRQVSHQRCRGPLRPSVIVIMIRRRAEGIAYPLLAAAVHG
jgi:hypothetical protein